MIYSDSRYSDGNIYRAYRPASKTYEATVSRIFPQKRANYWAYTWQIGDRLDRVAYRYYRTADEWWRIMDFNPEITDPHMIEPGTLVRIPNDSRT
jgi:hypothetical protein